MLTKIQELCSALIYNLCQPAGRTRPTVCSNQKALERFRMHRSEHCEQSEGTNTDSSVDNSRRSAGTTAATTAPRLKQSYLLHQTEVDQSYLEAQVILE